MRNLLAGTKALARRLDLAGALALALLLFAACEVSQAETATTPAAAPAASAPKLVITSVRLFPLEKSPDTQCGTQDTGSSAAGTLVSSGDLDIAVKSETYDIAMTYIANGSHKIGLRLFLNGVDVSDAATLYAKTRSDKNGTVNLRYHLSSDTGSQPLWQSVYRQNGSLIKAGPLDIALGWPSTGPNSSYALAASAPATSASAASAPAGEDVACIAVASKARVISAALVLVVLLIVTGLVLLKTDAFRDDLPPWLETAERYEVAYENAAPADRSAVLKLIDPNYGTDAANAVNYAAQAELASSGQIVDVNNSAAAAVGLLLRGTVLPKASFSLTRVQLGAWFVFAVATGVFLWIVYGELIAITGSLLTILGISVGTAGASFAAEPPKSANRSTASQGFFLDLVTGFDKDQTQQVHRYQSLVANVMLLVVGAYSVITNLAFPVFEATWLVFLGISGTTFAAGKQFVEADADKPAKGAPATGAPSATGPTGGATGATGATDAR